MTRQPGLGEHSGHARGGCVDLILAKVPRLHPWGRRRGVRGRRCHAPAVVRATRSRMPRVRKTDGSVPASRRNCAKSPSGADEPTTRAAGGNALILQIPTRHLTGVIAPVISSSRRPFLPCAGTASGHCPWSRSQAVPSSAAAGDAFSLPLDHGWSLANGSCGVPRPGNARRRVVALREVEGTPHLPRPTCVLQPSSSPVLPETAARRGHAFARTVLADLGCRRGCRHMVITLALTMAGRASAPARPGAEVRRGGAGPPARGRSCRPNPPRGDARPRQRRGPRRLSVYRGGRVQRACQARP